MAVFEYKGIDAAGNESAGSGRVTVLDLEPPALASCPPDGQVSAPPGALSWPFEYSVPAATDNCPGVDVACAPPSGEAFSVGATSVACVAVDASDLTDQCGFEVVVEGRPVVEIPTLSRGALAILGLLLSVVACAALRSSRSRREG